MKCIENALSENRSGGPYKGWWGTVRDGKRYLMRYDHTMLVIDEKEKIVLAHINFDCCTITDMRGIKDAVNQLSKKKVVC